MFDSSDQAGQFQERPVEAVYEDYVGQVGLMIDRGHIDCLSHLDLAKIHRFRPSGDFLGFFEPLLQRIKKADLAMEINTAGWRKPVGEQYPDAAIIRRGMELGIPLTFSSDAHSHVQLGEDYGRLRGIDFVPRGQRGGGLRAPSADHRPALAGPLLAHLRSRRERRSPRGRRRSRGRAPPNRSRSGCSRTAGRRARGSGRRRRRAPGPPAGRRDSRAAGTRPGSARSGPPGPRRLKGNFLRLDREIGNPEDHVVVDIGHRQNLRLHQDRVSGALGRKAAPVPSFVMLFDDIDHLARQAGSFEDADSLRDVGFVIAAMIAGQRPGIGRRDRIRHLDLPGVVQQGRHQEMGRVFDARGEPDRHFPRDEGGCRAHGSYNGPDASLPAPGREW